MVDKESAEELSNGRVYKVTKLKVPNNVIIYRIKSLAHYYEYLTDEEKTELVTWEGTGISISKGDATPIGTTYWLLNVSGNASDTEPVWVEFPPLDYNENTGKASVMKVPPGEYNLYMGFRSKGHPYVDVYFNSGNDPIPTDAVPVQEEVPAAKSSPWNYDRVNDIVGGISKWNGIGGLVGTVVVTGDDLTTFRIKVKVNKPETAGGARNIQIYHWALKPTANNY
jgi:hypothetical protein